MTAQQFESMGSTSMIANALDQAAWWGFLSLLVVCSFIGDIYPSKLWLLITAGFCLTLALHFAGVALGARFNHRGLRSGVVILGLLAVSMLWLQLQISVPVQHFGHELLGNVAGLKADDAPEWYEPSLSWSVTPSGTRSLLLSELIPLLALCLMISSLSTRQRLKQVLTMLALVGGVHAVVAIIAKYADVTLVDVVQLDGHFDVARGWFINRNHLASFLILTSIGWISTLVHQSLRRGLSDRLVLALLSQQLLVKILCVMLMVLTVIAITLTSSRAGILSLVGVVFLLVVSVIRRQPSGQWRRFLLIGMMLVVVLAVGYFGDMVLQRFSGQEALLGERGEQWCITWSLIKQNVLLGYGGNSYATMFQMARGDDGLRQLVYNQAHNDYLHIWLEQGFIGLMLWLGLICITFYRGLKSIKRTQSTLVISTGMASLAVITAALTQSLVDFNLQILSIRIYFFVIIAMIVSAPSISHVKVRSGHVDGQ